MKILDRYIVKPIAVTFLITVLTFCLLYVLIDTACNLDEYLNLSLSMSILFQYYLSYLPLIVVQTSSIACLIAVLFTFTGLNTHNEIIALRSSGMNFWQITKSALTFSLLVSALVMMVNERYVPLSDGMVQKIKNENMITEADSKGKKQAKINNLTFYGLKNRLYFIDSFDPNTYELEGITIIGYDDHQNVQEKIVALKGVWTGIAWKFYQCHVTDFAGSVSGPTIVKVYPEKLMDIRESPKDFLKQRLNVNSMNIKQLNNYINRFSKSGADRAVDNLRVDLHQKIAFPFGNIVIVLVGLPFALMTGRRKAQTFTSLAIACAIGFLYYVVNAVGLAFGKGGLFPPFISAWLAPGIFGAAAFYIIKTRF